MALLSRFCCTGVLLMGAVGAKAFGANYRKPAMLPMSANPAFRDSRLSAGHEGGRIHRIR